MRRQELVFVMLMEARQERLQRCLDVADGSDRDGSSFPEMRGIAVDLNDRRFVRIELAQRRRAEFA
jgi:hypothetical protein